LIVAGLVLLIIWLLLSVWGIAKKEEMARRAVKETQHELLVLQERHDTIENDLRLLDTERGQEAVLRETFGVVKPGEEVLIVVPPKELPPPPPKTFWQKVMDFFTGK